MYFCTNLIIFTKKNMNNTFKIWETNRKKHLDFLENYSLEALNKIPEGFSNNLIWNAAHTIVTQQGLTYRLSGLPVNITKEIHHKYKIGTTPTIPATKEEVEEIKKLLLSTFTKTKEDYHAGIFTTPIDYETHIGFHVNSIEEVLQFNNYHEAIHLGMMMSIKRFL